MKPFRINRGSIWVGEQIYALVLKTVIHPGTKVPIITWGVRWGGLTTLEKSVIQSEPRGCDFEAVGSCPACWIPVGSIEEMLLSDNESTRHAAVFFMGWLEQNQHRPRWDKYEYDAALKC